MNMDQRILKNPIETRLETQRRGNTASHPVSQPPKIGINARLPSSSSTSTVNSLRAPSVQAPLFPSLNSSQRSSSGDGGLKDRKKVHLEPGCSPLDWARLNSSGSNLRGIHPSEFPVRVTNEILKQHKTKDDCWTVLGGKVYNITPYIKFHPGGVDEIMKCAGKDGTSLFIKYHAWVNYERMLENCLVGFYIGS